MQKCSWHTCIKRRKAGLEIYHNSDLIFKVLYTHIHIEWAIHCRLLVLIFSKWVMDKVFTFSLRLWIFFYNKYDWLFLQLVSYKSSYEKESRQKYSKWLFQSSCSRLMLSHPQSPNLCLVDAGFGQLLGELFGSLPCSSLWYLDSVWAVHLSRGTCKNL